MDRQTHQLVDRMMRALERIADAAEEMNDHLDEANVVMPNQEEEIIADALRMDGEQNLADKVRIDGIDNLAARQYDTCLSALDRHGTELPAGRLYARRLLVRRVEDEP